MNQPNEAEWTRRLGRVTMEPHGPVTAGQVGQWTFRYVVGDYGIDEGGTIKFAHRFASDWEPPQFDRPAEPGYTTVTTDGHAKLRVRYDRKGHVRPWMKSMVIDVYDGSLSPGDMVTIILGDQSQGSPGSRAQTFVEADHEFRFLVDPTNACMPRRLPTSPVAPVIPAEPKRLVCIVPTLARTGRPVEIFAGWRDAFGNPCPNGPEIDLTWDGPGDVKIEGGKQGATGRRTRRPVPKDQHRPQVSDRDQRPPTLTAAQPATGWLIATSGDISARSNPITFTKAPPPYEKFWGDLHAQSGSTIGSGTERAYFEYARDAARLDFTSHQGNDFQVTDELWAELNRLTAEFHEDHRFVVFPGYEWSANTPAGGDRNVFYREEGHPILRSSHWQINEPETNLSPAHPADELFRKLRANVPMENVLLGSHVGGRYADIRRYFDQELGPLVELCSCWGVFEWMLSDALEKGYIVGVMCNSDGHKGRPGAEGPGAGEFGIAGGLTCVLAHELTRPAVFDALKQRRCYGTTGARINLDFTLNGRPMGSLLQAGGELAIQAQAICPGPAESLTLYRNMEPVQTIRPAAFEDVASSRRLRIAWGGARMRGRGRRVQWNGRIRLQGAKIQSAQTFAFDSPADGIRHQTPDALEFNSQTTGDIDGIDLWLDQWTGTVHFESEAGTFAQPLSELNPARRYDLGGLDMHVRFERYPEAIGGRRSRDAATVDDRHPPAGNPRQLTLTAHLPAPVPNEGRIAYWVKLTQKDGQMAWSSPIYVEAKEVT